MFVMDDSGPQMKDVGTTGSKAGLGCATVFVLPFLLIGLGTLFSAVVSIATGGGTIYSGLFLIFWSFGFIGIPAMMLYTMFKRYRQAVRAQNPQSHGPVRLNTEPSRQSSVESGAEYKPNLGPKPEYRD